jgi:serine/threonine protein kinase
MSAGESIDDILVQLKVLTETEWRDAPPLTVYQREQITRRSSMKRPGWLRCLRLNDYLLLEQAGKGAMGVVYRAWDISHKRLVALKMLTRDSAEARGRFRREAKLLARLKHDCLARFYGQEDVAGATPLSNEFILVLEFIDGIDIEHRINAQGPLSWVEAAAITIEVLDVLTYIHGKKVVHRDVKPANLMVPRKAAGWLVKLLDLGLGKFRSDAVGQESLGGSDDWRQTVAGRLLGTPGYMSPEQWSGKSEVPSASDVYNLGATLYFMLTGRTPFHADTLAGFCLAHTQEERPFVSAIRQDVPAALDQLVRRMMALQPADRGTPPELKRELRRLITASQSDPTPSSALPPPAPFVESERNRNVSSAPSGPSAPAPVLTPTQARRQRARDRQAQDSLGEAVRRLGTRTSPGRDAGAGPDSAERPPAEPFIETGVTDDLARLRGALGSWLLPWLLKPWVLILAALLLVAIVVWWIWSY